MRLTIIGIIFTVTTVLCVDRLAEQTFAQTVVGIEAEDSDSVEADAFGAWERNFGLSEETMGAMATGYGRSGYPVAAGVGPYVAHPAYGAGASAAQRPYLAYFYDRCKNRTHIVPYEGGYDDPSQMPRHQRCWEFWLSSHPSQPKNRPQIKYLSYYDPMPPIVSVEQPTRLQLVFQRTGIPCLVAQCRYNQAINGLCPSTSQYAGVLGYTNGIPVIDKKHCCKNCQRCNNRVPSNETREPKLSPTFEEIKYDEMNDSDNHGVIETHDK